MEIVIKNQPFIRTVLISESANRRLEAGWTTEDISRTDLIVEGYILESIAMRLSQHLWTGPIEVRYPQVLRQTLVEILDRIAENMGGATDIEFESIRRDFQTIIEDIDAALGSDA